MPISEHEQKLLLLQNQIRENQVEMQDYLKDLDNWQTEISKKEKALKDNKESDKTSSRVLPPIRNSSRRKKKRKGKSTSETTPAPKSNRIRSYDYAAWEKYDADKVCEEISEEKSSSSESLTDEELEELQHKQQALDEKDKGNEYFKKGEYMLAIDHYSRGLQCDPTNPLLAANRAMALLKQDKYAAAEEDCNTCLTLDPTYIKGYLRRATAKCGLLKYKEALGDYHKVLRLDPSNKLAQMEADKLQKKIEIAEKSDSEKSVINDEDNPEGAVFKDIFKPPSERSKKPLRRIEIEEIGVEEKLNHDQLTAKMEQSRSNAERKQINKDKLSFQQYTGDSKKTPPKVEEIQPKPAEKTQPKPTEKTQPKPAEKTQPKPTEKTQPKPTEVKKDSNKISQYLKVLNPESYPTLVNEFMDAEMITKLCANLQNAFPNNAEVIVQHLSHLCKVKRFQVAVMFLSSSEKQVIKDLFNYLKQQPNCEVTELQRISKMYGVG
eukprot:XP_014770342.1 PREDICTED: RNA polymerase II-associated protein 3-like [Octopus bimaculoides]